MCNCVSLGGERPLEVEERQLQAGQTWPNEKCLMKLNLRKMGKSKWLFALFLLKTFFNYLFLTASIVWHIVKHICASAVVCCQILLNKHMQVYFPYILYRYNPCMVLKAHHSLDTLWWECYDPLRVKLGDGWPTGDTPDPLEVMSNLADNKQGWTNSVMCCFVFYFVQAQQSLKCQWHH